MENGADLFWKTIYQTRISHRDQIIAQFIRSLIARAVNVH
jgi:hypothetical protein